MHPLVQSAIEAANQGDKPKAINLIRQALTANPSDVDAWLVLAAVMDDPQRKRQCLNKVLSLDPTNKIARDELLEMDRIDMGAAPSQPVMESVSMEESQPEPPSYSSSEYRYEETPIDPQEDFSEQPVPVEPPAPKPISKPQAEKRQVFKYSLATRILTFGSVLLFGCLTLFVFVNVTAGLIPCGLFLIMLPVVWIVTAQVEVSEKGIRTSQMFGLLSKQVGWNGIASIKSSSMKQNLQLITKKGNTLKVTSQVQGYPVIIETLRRKRPDLFGASPAATSNRDSLGYEDSPSMGSPAASFSGTRRFSKNFFRQYGILLIVIPFCLFAVWTALMSPESRVGALIAAAFCGIMIVLPFLQVNSIKVEPDKLTIETMFEEKVFRAREIKEIKMQSVRGRYGRVTNYLNIIPVRGKNYPVQGFSDGDEIIYGILSNWWNSYQGR